MAGTSPLPSGTLATARWRVRRAGATAIAGLAGAVALGTVACKRQDDPAAAAEAARPPLVRVRQAEMTEFRPDFLHPAILEARQVVNLRPQVAGPIKTRSVSPGARVRKGDVLFEIDDSHYRASLQEAEAALALAEANAEQAADDLARIRRVAGGGVSERDRSRAEALDKAAEAQVIQAGARLEEARLNLEHTRIVAPFDGKISAANYGVGDFVTSSPPMPQPLVTLVELDPIYAVAAVDQKLYLRYKAKRTALAEAGEEVPRLRATLILPDGSVYPHEGKFVAWDYSMAGQRGTVSGRAEFPNEEGLLLPGQNVSVRGETIEPIRRILVPQKAVGQDQQGHYLMVVAEGATVERRNIEVGIRRGPDWAVVEGLREGETVIVEGLQKVRPGTRVEARPAGDETESD